MTRIAAFAKLKTMISVLQNADENENRLFYEVTIYVIDGHTNNK